MTITESSTGFKDVCFLNNCYNTKTEIETSFKNSRKF